MANIASEYSGNVSGKFYVDDQCMTATCKARTRESGLRVLPFRGASVRDLFSQPPGSGPKPFLWRKKRNGIDGMDSNVPWSICDGRCGLSNRSTAKSAGCDRPDES
jgi:hypothetical protein